MEKEEVKTGEDFNYEETVEQIDELIKKIGDNGGVVSFAVDCDGKAAFIATGNRFTLIGLLDQAKDEIKKRRVIENSKDALAQMIASLEKEHKEKENDAGTAE